MRPCVIVPHCRHETLVAPVLAGWDYRLKIAYEIRDSAGARATTGSTVQVAVNIATRERHVCVPEALRQRLGAWLERLA